MNRLLLACLAFLLCSCAASGLRYQDHPLVTADLSPDDARITVLRPDNVWLMHGRSARVEINGLEFGKLAKGGFLVRDVPAGVYTLSADVWDAPGRCLWQELFEGGRRYYFMVAAIPPPPPTALELVLGPFAQAGGKLGAVANIALAAGAAAKPPPVRCEGAFSISPVDAGMLGGVEELRESR